MTRASDITDALMTVLDRERAEAVIEHRRVTIKAPLTLRAAQLLAKEMAKCADPNAAADEMIMNLWRGFRSDWVKAPRRPSPSYQRNADSAHSDFADQLFGSSASGREDDRHGQRSIDADFIRH